MLLKSRNSKNKGLEKVLVGLDEIKVKEHFPLVLSPRLG